jgi:trans-2,3-dihydro-3-hydroxyanthranilate isomerase
VARRYSILDVFADKALQGNPLAVVMDADGLDDSAMQAIAREFNLSETVFVREPQNPINTAAIRIFTPARELPFAGHPTVGTAVLLAHLRAGDLLRAQDLRVVLEENIGEVVCVARHRRDEAMAAYFTLPRLPERAGEPPDPAAFAADFGLDRAEIGFDAHGLSAFSAGVPFLFGPLASLDALARARPGGATKAPVYLYARAAEGYRARMFGAGLGVYEDPATGSAAAAFAGAVMTFEKPADGEHMISIEQGVEMGRPSRISLGLEVENGALRSATIGGAAVIVGEGTLRL